MPSLPILFSFVVWSFVRINLSISHRLSYFYQWRNDTDCARAQSSQAVVERGWGLISVPATSAVVVDHLGIPLRSTRTGVVMGTIMLDDKMGGMLDHDLIEENL